jgi:hypothetical protein
MGYWGRLTNRRLSRRRALAGAAGVGMGCAALSLIGCRGGGEEARWRPAFSGVVYHTCGHDQQSQARRTFRSYHG